MNHPALLDDEKFWTFFKILIFDEFVYSSSALGLHSGADLVPFPIENRWYFTIGFPKTPEIS